MAQIRVQSEFRHATIELLALTVFNYFYFFILTLFGEDLRTVIHLTATWANFNYIVYVACGGAVWLPTRTYFSRMNETKRAWLQSKERRILRRTMVWESRTWTASSNKFCHTNGTEKFMSYMKITVKSKCDLWKYDLIENECLFFRSLNLGLHVQRPLPHFLSIQFVLLIFCKYFVQCAIDQFIVWLNFLCIS